MPSLILLFNLEQCSKSAVYSPLGKNFLLYANHVKPQQTTREHTLAYCLTLAYGASVAVSSTVQPLNCYQNFATNLNPPVKRDPLVCCPSFDTL